MPWSRTSSPCPAPTRSAGKRPTRRAKGGRTAAAGRGGRGAEAGRLTDVARRMEVVRLGQGVDSTGRLAPAALERTLRALRGYARVIEDRSATAVRMVATRATRDAANAADFVD